MHQSGNPLLQPGSLLPTPGSTLPPMLLAAIPIHISMSLMLREKGRILTSRCPRLIARNPARVGPGLLLAVAAPLVARTLKASGCKRCYHAQGSRRAAKLRTGFALAASTINGQPAVLGARVSSSDQLRLDGRLIRQRETGGGSTAFVVHRSPGESLTQPNTETQSEGGDAPGAALIERLPTRAGRRFITISPMPRVDGGLELVTSDGELGVKLQRSVRNLVSQFSVRVLGELSAEQIENILGGTLDSGERIEVVSCEAFRRRGSQSLVHPRSPRRERQRSSPIIRASGRAPEPRATHAPRPPHDGTRSRPRAISRAHARGTAGSAGAPGRGLTSSAGHRVG